MSAYKAPAGVRDLRELENAIGYRFRSRNLLVLALTHSSYSNEHGRGRAGNNERLEFLGDAVLECVSSEYLYGNYPDLPEGEMSKLRASMVCEPTLARCSDEFDLRDFIRLGKGEEQNGGRNRPSILSDALEALIGAVYLDGGFSCARTFILEHVMDGIAEKRSFTDSKTALQEIAQSRGLPVEYLLLSAEGPDHDRTYEYAVLIGGTEEGRGTGHSKKAAEQEAARKAIENLTENEGPKCI